MSIPPVHLTELTVYIPFTYRSEDGVHVSIHEAALVDYASMTLDLRRDGRLKADLTPRQTAY